MILASLMTYVYLYIYHACMCRDLQLITAGTEISVLWGPRWLMWFYLAVAQHHTAIHCPTLPSVTGERIGKTSKQTAIY